MCPGNTSLVALLDCDEETKLYRRVSLLNKRVFFSPDSKFIDNGKK